MPLINAGFRFLRQGLCIFMRSQNLRGFALNKKDKTKQKDFAMCVTESKRLFTPLLFIAQALALIARKLNLLAEFSCKYFANLGT